MELRRRRVTAEEFDRITAEIRAIVGARLKDHKDGDAERLLTGTK